MLYKFKVAFTFFFIISNVLLFGSNEIDLNDNKIQIVNLGLSKDTQIINIQVNSSLNNPNFVILKSNFDYLSIESKNNKSKIYVDGQTVANKITLDGDPYPIFSIDQKELIIVKVLSNEPIILPIQIIDKSDLSTIKFQRDIFSSIFIGIIISLLLYNLTLYFFLKDYNYLYYCLYLFFISIAQLDVTGFNFYIFSGHTGLFNTLFHLCSGLSGIFGILFIQKFLDTRKKARRGHIFLNVILGIYTIVLALIFLNQSILAYQFMQLGGISLIVILFVSSNLARKGSKQGVYVSISYFVLFIGIFLYTLKDLDVVPFNIFTNYTLTIGVAIQAILLSLALADSINSLKKEKESANLRVIEEVTKNEELVRNQNITLEKKVNERTSELEEALNELKSTQSQLVQSEKMASLGVLTAGIAHEINNPINFVTANVIPLRENIDEINMLLHEYKNIDQDNFEKDLARISAIETEMDLTYTVDETKQLINGIEEGARRTHSIVDGLKTFSRSDSGAKEFADINLGIKSTISVLKSRLNNVKLNLNLDNSLPLLECQIGKINQVTLNVLNNAIDTVEEKFGANSKKSEISVGSAFEDNCIKISVTDNGNGMNEKIQKKVMEPFFTTKKVGDGTGLGLSISYSIVEDHKGEILLESVEGEGTTFTLVLPKGNTTL
jgi:signal transduction histidine kinase